MLDTNVWVSAFLKPSGPPGQVVSAWSRDKFSAVTSLSQLTELAQVLNRPRLLRRFKYSQWEAAIASPGELAKVLREALKVVKDGKPAVVDVVCAMGRNKDRLRCFIGSESAQSGPGGPENLVDSAP